VCARAHCMACLCVCVCVCVCAASQIAISPLCPYRKARVFSGWGCDVQLKGRIETDYLVNSWHPPAAWNRPERRALICKWITSRLGPPLPFPHVLPSLSSLFFVFLLVHSVPRSSFFILCHDRCWAGLPLFPISFFSFWDHEESRKDFHMWFFLNTSPFSPLPSPAVEPGAFILCVPVRKSMEFFLEQVEMSGSRHCFRLNNGREVFFFWLRTVLIGRYEKKRPAIEGKPRGNWLPSVSLCLCPTLWLSDGNARGKKIGLSKP